MFISCREGKIEKIKQLLMRTEINPNWHNHQGFSPLYIACQIGQIEAVKLLLNDQRIDVQKEIDSSDYDGTRTPLHIACEFGHTEIVKLLINDPRIDINKPNDVGSTPLFITCYEGHFEIAKLLLSDPRIDGDKANSYNKTPFYITCAFGRLEILEYIFAYVRGINFNRRDGDGLSAIEKAIEFRDEDINHWESDEDFKNRRKLYSDLVELIQKFEKNPNETRFELRKKFGLLGKKKNFLFISSINLT